MEIVEIDVKHIGSLRELWAELNHFHEYVSVNFSKTFLTNSFERRCSELLGADELKIWCCLEGGVKSGFIIASVRDNNGVIESLHVAERFRSRGMGSALMGYAMSWFAEKPLLSKRLTVIYGNSAALAFYEKFGFKINSLQLLAES